MFADPLSFAPTPRANGTGATVTMYRLPTMDFQINGTSMDEPIRMKFANTLPKDGIGNSRFQAQYSHYKNAPGTPAYGQKKLSDNKLVINVTVNCDRSLFTDAEIQTGVERLVGLVNSPSAQAAWLAGQV